MEQGYADLGTQTFPSAIYPLTRQGVKIECDGPGCNGLPCACDPSIHGMNGCSSGSVAGAGGAAFCVVTVPPGTST